MCAGAIVLARPTWLLFGALDPKAGACGSLRDVVRDPRLNHRVALLPRGARTSAGRCSPTSSARAGRLPRVRARALRHPYNARPVAPDPAGLAER
jgi:hypothetical protein